MLYTHPHIKYIRLCDEQDGSGQMHDKLIIETDLEISDAKLFSKDYCLIDLATTIKEFQTVFEKELGCFPKVEIIGRADS